MSTKKWVLLGRLRRALKKVKFLLNLNLNRWRIARSITGAGSLSRRTGISFNDSPGLRASTDDILINSSSSNIDQDDDSGSSRGQIQRTPSYPSDQQDIDKRAEIFIANFRNQLRMERQVSLELRYSRRDSSFDTN